LKSVFLSTFEPTLKRFLLVGASGGPEFGINIIPFSNPTYYSQFANLIEDEGFEVNSYSEYENNNNNAYYTLFQVYSLAPFRQASKVGCLFYIMLDFETTTKYGPDKLREFVNTIGGETLYHSKIVRLSFHGSIVS
jgi:hypothetical protein